MRRSPAIRSAYLFGSIVKGLDNQRSDVDTAVRVEEGLTPEEMFEQGDR